MEYYSEEVENQMVNFYISLNEKDKRHYAAIESIKFGHGGVAYIADLFGCSRKTIYDGIDELKNNDLLEVSQIRRDGGGRIATTEKIPNIDEIFLTVVNPHIAGDPMNKKIRWIKISRSEIGKQMKKLGVKVSRNIVRKLLKKHGFVKRKMQRKTKTGENKNREQQFQIIEEKKAKFDRSKNPIISFDTKKKEYLGKLHREGQSYCTEAPQSYDHDFPSLSEGKIVPHGIYDMKNNKACINIGVENETAEFICDSIKKWWNQMGKKDYSEATEILALCDAGGANSYKHHIFKVELQKLVNSIGLPINISHYPPYASKWNPIEHRVFPHVTRAMEGLPINTIEEAKELISKTETTTGLSVRVNIMRKIYDKGKTVAQSLINNVKIKRNENLGHLNYTILPEAS